jgi:hypothetical protein
MRVHEQAIWDAILAGGGDRLRHCATSVLMQVCEGSLTGDDVVDLIIHFLNEQPFLEVEGSHHLIMLIQVLWAEIPDARRVSLLPELEGAYGRFRDWMSWFVISEILGECVGDERSFQILLRLRSSTADHPRSFIPHAFEHVIKSSHDRTLASRAQAELARMADDPSVQVREEVARSLQRLKSSGRI